MFYSFVTKHACDGQTDIRKDGQNYDPKDRASIAASRGKKNVMSTCLCVHICLGIPCTWPRVKWALGQRGASHRRGLFIPFRKHRPGHKLVENRDFNTPPPCYGTKADKANVYNFMFDILCSTDA